MYTHTHGSPTVVPLVPSSSVNIPLIFRGVAGPADLGAVGIEVGFDLRLMGAVKLQGPCQRSLQLEPGQRRGRDGTAGGFARLG